MARCPRTFSVVVLVVALLLAVLPACSSAPPPAPTAAPPQAAATAAPAAAAPAPAAAPAAPTAAPAAAAPATAAPAPTKIAEYNLIAFNDMSGPAADTSRGLGPGRTSIVNWWNETRGKELGVKLNLKTFDTRYDATQAVSLWSGALVDKPIALWAQGGPDVSALTQRMSADKVPMFTSAGGNGYNWKPDLWLFHTQPTYVSQFAGFVNWRLSNWTENRPLRVGHITTEQSPSLKEQAEGFQISVNKGLFGSKVEYTGIEWMLMTATDAANQVKRLLDKKTDVIQTFIPGLQQNAIVRALQQYKADSTKIVLYGASGIVANSKGSSLQEYEGYFEVGAHASDAETDNEAYKIYQQYQNSPGSVKYAWDSQVIFGMASAVLSVRAIERAAKAVGADKITGEAVYNAMFSGPFTVKELVDLVPDVTYTKEAPFPTKNIKVRIGTVKNGKFVLATPDWVAAPDVAKW